MLPNPLFTSAHKLFHEEKYEEASQFYLRCIDDPESLFYGAICLERLQKHEEAHALRQQIFENFSSNPFAEEALFLNMLNSNIRDLQQFIDHFPKSPYLAFFWILKGEELYKQELFKESAEYFDKVLKQLDGPLNNYFLEIKHKAHLFKAKIEYALCKQSIEKTLHIEYGLAILRQSLREQEVRGIEWERDFLFAQFFIEKDPTKALKWIDKSIAKYKKENIEKNPYLFKLFKLKGEIFWKRNKLKEALTNLENAEAAYLPNQLSETEILDLWFLKASIDFKIGNQESALNHLAAIINSPVASIKRLEAMLFRQEIFTSMGRIDLASRHTNSMQLLRKQWEETHGKLDFSTQ